ncbi:hypothetical protein BSKO_11365 [Bryopsis sp. KO-2023]|nr:hypothetical protein BSKO_11365 [Bryopsis sp. KO-2023]
MTESNQQEHQGEKDEGNLTRVEVVDSHMTSEFEQSALEICMEAVGKYKHLKDIAFHVKHSYDKKYPGSGKATEGVYHCIVGKNFASAISHETRQYIRMKIGILHVILWKSKDSPFHFNET